MGNISDKPKRALLAYCALVDRLRTPGVTPVQSLMPFFSEACSQFAGELFDAQKFSDAVADRYGIKIPRLAALGFTEHLAADGLLVDVSGNGSGPVYRYAKAQGFDGNPETPVSESDIEKILASFVLNCREDERLIALSDSELHEAFLDRLLHIDSMKLLARREASISAKRSSNTLTRKAAVNDERESRDLHLDFMTSQFLLDLREGDSAKFEVVSNVAFANMAAEAVACFLEPTHAGEKLDNLTVFLDSPLLLDMLGVNEEYADYGKELLAAIKNGGAHPAVLEHCVAEAETAVHAQLAYLRSGVNQMSYKWGTSSKPDLLNALLGNVGARTEDRLGIKVQRDPDVSLHRRAPSTVGDIEAAMNSRMQAWRNEEAKEHDRKSVWSMLAIRDTASPCPRICDAHWILVTRNTALVSIANQAWASWLKGTTKHGSGHVEKWAPIAMSDKQFAGYVWARSGGGNVSIPRARLLAHCSAAVRPRADIKAKAYNLVLELSGKDEAEDVAALLEDREGVRALMRATKGDPEDVTAERLPFILEKVKLAAGEFAAAKVREEHERLQEEMDTAHSVEQQRILDQLANVEREKRADAQAAEVAVAKERASQEKLITENLALQEQLRQKNLNEAERIAKILNDGLAAGIRTFRLCRWGLAITFGILTAIAGYISNVSPTVSVCLTATLSVFGFWFVPDLLMGSLERFSMRRLRRYVRRKDEKIAIPSQVPDFKNRRWDAFDVAATDAAAPVTHVET